MAVSAQLTTISFNGVPIGGVKSIDNIGSGSASEKDKTTLASVAKESEPGLPDYGTMDITLLRDNDDLGQEELRASYAAQETHEVIVTVPEGTLNVCTFQGWVMSLTTDIKTDGFLEGTCKIRITGEPIWS